MKLFVAGSVIAIIGYLVLLLCITETRPSQKIEARRTASLACVRINGGHWACREHE
jgi:hypothetical protein